MGRRLVAQVGVFWMEAAVAIWMMMIMMMMYGKQKRDEATVHPE